MYEFLSNLQFVHTNLVELSSVEELMSAGIYSVEVFLS